MGNVSTSSQASDEFPSEVISNLTGMGFPEAEVRACLRASQGNPDIAVEFLMNGTPEQTATQASTGATSTESSTNSSASLASLRNHPQFNALRRLVQSNPSTLQSVLTQIGQQQPELLQEINNNQAAFLQMMNEPVEDDASSASVPASSAGTSGTSTSATTEGSSGTNNTGSASGLPTGMMEGMSNPAQMAQMLQNMTPAQLQSMATMMGLTPDQLTTTAQMISQMPSEQFQEYLNMAMQGGGLQNLMGEGAGGGTGPQVLRLNEEEMAAVNRLTDMGFDRAEAAQAYIACDKNEALAANLLMDGGFGFADDVGTGGAGPGAQRGTGGNDENEDMYD